MRVDVKPGRRLGLGAVAAELGVPRLTAWFWLKTGRLTPPIHDDHGQCDRNVYGFDHVYGFGHVYGFDHHNRHIKQ